MLNNKKKIRVIPGKINIFIDKGVNFINYFCFGGIMRVCDCFVGLADDSAINIDIDIVSPKKIRTENTADLTTYSKYFQVGNGQLCYFRKFFGFKFGLRLQKTDNRNFHIEITPHYLYLVHLRMENLFPLGVHLSDLLMIETINRGDLVLYGGSFLNTQTGAAAIIMAPRGVGKTYSLLKLIENKSFKIISEEVSYLDLINHEVNSICVPNTILQSGKNSGRVKFGAIFDAIFKRKSLWEVCGAETFANRGSVRRVYLLENSLTDSIEKVPINEANIRKIMSLQRTQFSYYYNPLLNAYAYYGNLDLDNICKKEQALFSSFISQVELFIVKASNFAKFSELIEANEKKDSSFIRI